MSNLDRLVSIAFKQAVKSTHQYKHGAVIFRQGKVISKGYNETHRGVSQYKGYWEGSCHAEIAALIRAKGTAAGASILIVRRHYRNSRPCNSCRAALQVAGIKNVFYTDDGNLVKEKI